VDLAIWLAPVFLLRFFRDAGALKAILVSLPPLVAVNVLLSRSVLPIPSLSFALGLQLYLTLLALLPFMLDALAHRILPATCRVLLLPSLVVAIPFVRSARGTYLHPVNGLNDLVLLQVAALAGVAGIWFVINLAASTANEIWEQRRSRRAARNAAAWLLVGLLVVYCFGSLRLRSEVVPSRVLRAAAIVPDPALRAQLVSSFATILKAGRLESDQLEPLRRSWTEVFQELLADSIAVGQAGFDLAVWSEGAAIVFKNDEASLLRQAALTARSNRMYLAIAFVLYESDIQPDGPGPHPVLRNELILLSPTGEVDWRHAKSRLAPGIEAAITIAGDGRLQTNDLGMSGAICYEMDFPLYIRQSGRLGAGVLLAPANDWFEIKNIHARSARLRAIENGVAVFRPAAGGISIAVDGYGRTLARMDTSRRVDAPMTAVLPLQRVPTLYSAWGNWMGWVALTIVALSAGIVAHRLDRQRSEERRPQAPSGV
jgi:apolipoprotein N-acyltransferase